MPREASWLNAGHEEIQKTECYDNLVVLPILDDRSMASDKSGDAATYGTNEQLIL